ncbi:hypothetical protein OIV83_004899 [Microbotryomycetes sp. JL201]|nr:hypothetical protein OIV83_004899 [Microbotryomycetes sp. JL201]
MRIGASSAVACATALLAAAVQQTAALPSTQLHFGQSRSKATGGRLVVTFEFNGREQTNFALDVLSVLGISDIWHANSTAIVAAADATAWAALDQQHAQHFGQIDLLRMTAAPVDEYLRAEPGLTSSPDTVADSAAAIANMRLRSRLQSIDDSIHDHYHPYTAINQIIREMAEQFPAFAKVVLIGHSSEGREILGLKVTNLTQPTVAFYEESNGFVDSDGAHAWKRKKGNKKHMRKPGFVVIGGQHAREWIAPATTLYLMHDLLLTTTSSHPSPLLNALELTFVPVTNPDGYQFTWAPEGDRLWRKNRQPVGDNCFGVDLNKNWAYKWSPGSRPNPCSDAFPGAKAFEAPELQAIRDYLLDTSNNVHAFLDLHSFGQMIMYPFSYSCDKSSPDEENHFEAVIGAAKALRAVHGKTFETGSVCEVSLTAPGDSIDWTYAAAKIRWSFAVELRGSVWAFLLPPDQIRPSGEEMSAALQSLANYVVQKEAGQRFDISQDFDR